MFFRLVKGFELWGLLVLMTAASMYFYYIDVSGEDFNSLLRNDSVYETELGNETYLISAANVKQYRFESMGISAYDAYRERTETVSGPTDDIIYGSFNFVHEEVNLLFEALGNLYIIPAILMMIFIPLFFGRMFSDGTVKNLISGGLSRGKIYLSSLLLTSVLDLVLLLINLASFVFWCMYYEWRPPVYLPVLIPSVILTVLVLLALTSVCIAVLFSSAKKTAAFITGFLLVFFTWRIGLNYTNNWAPVSSIDYKKEDYREMRDIMENKGLKALDQRFDLAEFEIRFSYNGRELDIYEDHVAAPVLKNILIVLIYADPALANRMGETYMMVRDGVVAVNMVSSILWISVSTGAGYLVFRKKEIHC